MIKKDLKLWIFQTKIYQKLNLNVFYKVNHLIL